MKELSKYDILGKKIKKISSIVLSFTSAYALATTKQKKQQVLKKYYNIILDEAHILFEIKNDCANYLENKENATMCDWTSIFYIGKISSELEKILVLEVIFNQKLDYNTVMQLIDKKLSEQDVINYLNTNLTDEERKILDIMSSKDFAFSKLPEEYKNKVLENHKLFMDNEINPYITKTESKQIQFLKGVKICEQNINVDLNVNIDIAPKKLQKGLF